MNDSLKMFLIALVTSVASQALLGPYILEFHGLRPEREAPVAPSFDDAETPQPLPLEPKAAPNERLSAPNLEGMSVAAARDRFRDRGIVIVEDGERAHVSAEPLTIVQQRPAPGATLSSNEIRVIVAKGPPAGPVPEVVGQPWEAARAKLLAAGFEVPEPIRKSVEKGQAGTVLEQNPSAGATARAGSTVQLVVAEKALVATPKVEGMFLRKAKETLESAGLTLGKVRRVERDGASNYVLTQDPTPGAEVEPGTAVALTVIAPY